MLERLQVAVRLRGGWEALDLGSALLLAYGRAVYAVWLPLVGGTALLLALLLHRWPWVAVAAFWWLKPLYDRLVLHVLGRAAFGGTPGLRETLRELPSVFRHGVLAGLLWRRLSPQRSYLLPVWQLEAQDGRGYRRRVRPLLRRGRFHAQVLTLACVNFELVVQIGVLVGIQLFVPRGSDFNVFRLLAGGDGAPVPGWLAVLTALLPFLAATAVEPYFVAAGFALYLNRRVQLEGWDLELAFRRLAGRLARVAALLLLLAAPLRPDGQAPAAPQPAARQRIEEVLQAPEFQTHRMEKVLRWKARKRERPPAPRSPWRDKLAAHLAEGMKALFIGAAVAMVAWFLWRIRAVFGRGAAAAAVPEPPAERFGLDLRPESLPADVAATALALLGAGLCRDALALLYRASLSRLVGRHGLDIPRGATESDCLALSARVLGPEPARYFSALTGAWQAAAYAHRTPAEAEQLCRRWSTAFEEPR